MPITSIKHKGLKRLFEKDDASKLPAELVEKIRDILHVLDTAETVEEMNVFPGWRLHKLKGDLKGMWAIAVTGNWRIVFDFEDGDAGKVDFIDYH
ncbi:MAG: type II toxin-antitoxin system RelE/ParE family toxin [Hyphomicrobiaceae bacterium]